VLSHRVFSAIVLIPIVAWVVYAGDWWFLGALAVAGTLAGREFYQMMRQGGFKPAPVIGLPLLVLLFRCPQFVVGHCPTSDCPVCDPGVCLAPVSEGRPCPDRQLGVNGHGWTVLGLVPRSFSPVARPTRWPGMDRGCLSIHLDLGHRRVLYRTCHRPTQALVSDQPPKNLGGLPGRCRYGGTGHDVGRLAGRTASGARGGHRCTRSYHHSFRRFRHLDDEAPGGCQRLEQLDSWSRRHARSRGQPALFGGSRLLLCNMGCWLRAQ